MDHNKEFFEKLFKKEYNNIYSFLLKKLGSPEDASDAAQETFSKIMGNNGAASLNSPRSYLFRIARNLVTDILRGKHRQVKFVSSFNMEHQPSVLPSPEMNMEFDERKKMLQNALKELPLKTQKIFILHRFKNYTYSEISEELKISPKTVEKHISRALFLIKKRLSETEK